MALGLGWFAWLRPGGDPASSTRGLERSAAPLENPATVPDPVAAGDPARSPQEGAPPVADSPPESDPSEFEGRGSIRGLVQVPAGLEFPGEFTVHVGPSRSLRGRQRALAKSVRSGGEVREFAVDDLPLGGYDVWIEAQGLRSRRRAVLLTRGSSSPYVILELGRMGFIDGFVFRASGAAAESVPVALEALPGGTRRETRTRLDGFYRFDNVEDGEYRLHVGPAELPFVEPRDLFFRAPSLRFPEVTLPPMADLLIHTQDHTGALLADVTVSGFGAKGGRIEVVTGGDGKAWALNLPPGRYRLQARSPDGRKTRETFDVSLEDGQECWLILR